jgi:hypothetical protein
MWKLDYVVEGNEVDLTIKVLGIKVINPRIAPQSDRPGLITIISDYSVPNLAVVLTKPNKSFPPGRTSNIISLLLFSVDQGKETAFLQKLKYCRIYPLTNLLIY